MKFLKMGLILSALALFIIACSQANSVNTNAPTNVNAAASTSIQPEVTPSAVDDLASARAIFTEKCVKCHKEDGTGGVTVFEDGTKVKAPNFTSERQKKNPDSDYIETIENGAKEDGMPAFKGKLSDDDIKDLVKYIRREFQGK